MLESVTRRRLALTERAVEIALLDWGGDGPLALLHHATGFCAAVWDLVAQPLRDRLHVVALDARGHGDSSKPADPDAYVWAEFGADIAAVARRIVDESGRPIALGVGHSFGGTTMLMAAAAEPTLFEQLVLVDPVLPPPPEMTSDPDPERVGRADRLVEGARKRRTLWPDRAEARASWAEKPLFEHWDARALDLYVAEAMADRPDGQVELKCPGEIEAAVFARGFESGVWELPSKVRCPTLILWATRGDFSRPIYEAFAARMPDARLEDVESGHLVPMETPELLARRLRELMAAPARTPDAVRAATSSRS